MLSGSDVKSWEDFQVQKMIGTPQHPILLRGFGLPASEGIQQSHVLILLEEISPRQQVTLENFQEQFHLTTRELAVVETLCKGLTNKEIAVELGIAEQTVKEHVKNVMVKTQASTRTGILALALSFTNDSVKGGRFPSSTLHEKESQVGQSRKGQENEDREHQKATPKGSLAKVSSAA
jgi:DNA-binding CsgD family transcriptional regulator